MKIRYLIDMDGVIYRGSEPIPGAAASRQFMAVLTQVI